MKANNQKRKMQGWINPQMSLASVCCRIGLINTLGAQNGKAG